VFTRCGTYNTSVTFEEELHLNNEKYVLVGVQRGGVSAVYRGDGTYLRIGVAAKIKKDLRFHKQMESAGFPVARLMAEGEKDDMSYFIEASLGERRLGVVFTSDQEQTGSIQGAHFEELCAVARLHFEAQCRTQLPVSWEEFGEGIGLARLLSEMPAEADAISRRFERVKHNITLPFVVTHGDFNAQNLYAHGVIDLEDSFPAPLGYDLMTVLTTVEFTPHSSDYEFYAKYQFSAEQRAEYLRRIDEWCSDFGLPPTSVHQEDLAFCRAVWMTGGLSVWPKLQKWRYDALLRTYSA